MTPGGAIRIDRLRVRAGRTDLLADIALDIASGERVAIVGANGAGKSTLLRTLTGMILPTEGTVTVLGQRIDPRTPPDELRRLRGRVGQVFQGLHLVARLSALENVMIGSLGRQRSLLTCARLFPADERERACAALDAVGMGRVADQRTDRLSGGERQKVAVARALNQNPALILADEPTANLDPSAAAEIAELLAVIAVERGLTLVTVVHTLQLLPGLAQRIIGMQSGRIAFDLPIEAVDDARVRALYRRHQALRA